MDTEHAEAKKKYDANLASERVRHAEEAKREKTMSSRRKRMREELSMRERMAKTPAAASSSTDDGDRFDVDRLRREGERLREEYAQREAEVDIARKQRMAVERATQKLHKEDRQVRLKWSRKKVCWHRSPSPIWGRCFCSSIPQTDSHQISHAALLRQSLFV